MSNVSWKSCTLPCYAKKEKYLHEISMFTFTNLFFPGLPNLGVKVRCTQNRFTAAKWTQNIPCNYSVYLHKRFYERFIKLRLINHGSSTFCLFTHLLFFVFLIINKIDLNRWKQNSRDISNCNICTKLVFYKC